MTQACEVQSIGEVGLSHVFYRRDVPLHDLVCGQTVRPGENVRLLSNAVVYPHAIPSNTL
jgi:hypothetical protein